MYIIWIIVFFDKIYNNTLLEGLRYNNKEYYYVRDITGCIEKIIDNNKKEMVLYRYTSYGQVETYINPSLSTSEQTIANILMNNNGFVYKGYYYDVETGLFYCNSRYYNPEWCRWVSPDDIDYLDPKSVNGLNLYCYCLNNPISYCDPSGHIAWWVALIIIGICTVALKGDSVSPPKYESGISVDDLDINGSNPSGQIKVKIDDISIEIVDSYKYNNEEDMKRILNIIMNSDTYKFYGYSRTEKSYLSEWKAHNAAYSLYKKGEWGDRTKSVNLNKNLKDDDFWFLYWLF